MEGDREPGFNLFSLQHCHAPLLRWLASPLPDRVGSSLSFLLLHPSLSTWFAAGLSRSAAPMGVARGRWRWESLGKT